MRAAQSSGGAPSQAAAPRLVHEHVAGLRFDREPCHAVRTTRGLRWTPMVWPFDDDPATGSADVCAVRHALGLLALRKVGPAEIRSLRRLRDGWRLPGLQAHATAHRGLSLQALAVQVREAIRHGRVCLLELQTEPAHRDSDMARSVRRLMTITGVEVEAGPVSRIRALLVLDPSDAQPWACGHNARLPITTPASEIVTVRQATGHLLRCRISAVIEWTPIPSRL